MNRLALFLLGVMALGGVLYLNSRKGHDFYGTRLATPKPVGFALEGPGGPVRLEDFKDRLVLIFFGYTHCPDVCPTTLLKIRKVFLALSEGERSRVQVIFVSVDPERDTPELADRYAKQFHPSFLGLSGSPEAIRQAAQAFGVYYRKSQVVSPTEHLVDHTATTFVVKEGKLALLFSPDKIEETERVVADLRALL
ncbi:MAG: SCO family protein [Thermus sp.]